jgi:hypothetical protein
MRSAFTTRLYNAALRAANMHLFLSNFGAAAWLNFFCWDGEMLLLGFIDHAV